jgi:gliding motility-associated-like protein
MKNYIVTALLVFLGISGYAQTYNMTNGTISTCTGTFYDNGGTGNYTASTDLTFTICPAIAGSKIKCTFTSFNVEASYDRLTIYDGPNTSSPSMGTYDNNAPLSGIVQATTSNSSGCLTFVFHSDGSVQYAGWEASISCTTPCQTVQSVLLSTTPTATAGYINICQGQTVSFNGSASFPQNGTAYTQSNATSTFLWTFGDGTSATGQNVTHTYTTGGGYDVQLKVTDIMGCVSTNSIALRVRVSTTPTFTGTNANPTTICLGQSTTLTGSPHMKPWSQPTGGTVAGTTFLPDGSGVSYNTSLTFNSFTPGQTVTSVNDLVSICLNMEHSYAGDLGIKITCPNGQVMQLVNYPNSMSYTYLGQATDYSSNPGMGMTYCFTPTGNMGTWYSNYNLYTETYTDADGNAVTSHPYLPAGNYAPDGTWTSLIGCPLNGTWTITVTDNLSIDDGYIFWWGVNFNPSLYPSLWGFTPTIASTTWQGNGITPPTANTVSVTPTATGAQTYTYHLVDNFGCSYDTTVTVNVTAGPAISISPASSTVCAGTPVTLTASGAATYTWSNSSSGPSITVSPTSTTTYSVTGYTAAGCTGQAAVTVTVNPIPTVSANANPAAVCPGQSSVLTATGAATYNWNPGSMTGSVITVNPTGTTTYTVTGTSAGCSSQTTVSVTVNPSITVTASASPASVCSGQSSVLTASGATSYTWTPGSLSGASISVNPTSTSTYTVSGNSLGCTGQATVTVTVTPTDNPAFSYSPSSLCQSGSDLAASITGGASGTFSGSSAGLVFLNTSTGLIDVSASTPGVYTVTFNTNGTCPATSTSTVSITAPPLANFIYAGPYCLSGTVTPVLGSGATTGTFSASPSGLVFSNTATGQINLTASTAGTYTVTNSIAASGGCAAVSATAQVELLAVPSANVPQNISICNGVIVNTVSLSGTPSGVTFIWTNSNPSIGLASSGNGDIPSFTAVNNGSSNATALITVTPSANGCTGNPVTFQITVFPTPVISISPANPVICAGGSVVLTGNGGSTYLWAPGTGLSGQSGTSVIASPTSNTSYQVTGTINGCTNTASVNITVNTTIPVFVNPTSVFICPGYSTTLTASGASNYTWSPPAGLSSASGSTVMASPSVNTVYTVVGTDAGGCTGSASVVVSINSLAIISYTAEPTVACTPLTSLFTFIPGSNIIPGSCTWDFDDGSPASHDTIVTHTFTDPGNYTVVLHAQTMDGCNVTTSQIMTVYAIPEAEFIAHPDIVTTENPEVGFFDQSANETQWLWDFGDPLSNDHNSSTAESPNHVYSIPGEYTVTLIASNDFGCADTTTGRIIVHQAFYFWIPNAFSPNGDQLNDFFQVKGLGYLEDTYTIRIFDRWGKEVYFSSDINNPWDGMDEKGKVYDHGLFVYQIKITDESMHEHVFTGYFTLLR